MKKGLLTLAAGLLATAGVFGQAQNLLLPAENNYWDPAVYPAWDSIAATHMISFHPDSAWGITSVKDVTDFSNPKIVDAWSANGGARYSIAPSGSSLAIETNFSITEWANVQLDMSQYSGEQGAPTSASTDMSEYTIKGYIVDMTQGNFVISGEIMIPADFPTNEGTDGASFTIRTSIVDAHGHEWNAGGDAADTIAATDYGSWVPFEIDYEAIDAEWGFDPNPGDAWGESQHNMPRIHMPTSNDVRYPMDTANVTGVRFYLEPGQLYADATVYTIELKNIVIGRAVESLTKATIEPVSFVPDVMPAGAYTINHVAISEAAAPAEFAQNGAEFSFDGEGSLVNVLGEVVASGNGSLTAPAAGIYVLVVEGASAKVAVK